MAVLLLAALGLCLFWTNRDYRIRDWLFVPYSQTWLVVAFFALPSLAIGFEILKRLGNSATLGLNLGERWLVAFGIGVLTFALGVFIAGILHLYGWAFFALWPVLLLVGGGKATLRELKGIFRHRSHLKRFLIPHSFTSLAALLFLAYGILLVYSQVLAPDNVGYDARWYHLPIAEHYVAAGGIDRFKEGWYLGAYPQLASWIYTWAFQLPFSSLYDRVTLCSHVEFSLFLVTLSGVPLLARRLLNGRRAPASTAAFFLFPSIWLYDSNLITGADHILAFWACPLAITVFAFARQASHARAFLVAACLAGATLTKFQALYLIVPTVTYILWILVQQRAWRPALTGLGSAAVLTSPYWLKNFIFYGDPVFPLLYQHLSLHPFSAGAGAAIEEVFKTPMFAPTGTTAQRIWEGVKVTFTFSFIPHDWDTFKGKTPVFGFLFTMLSPAWLILRDRTRPLLLILGVHIGVFCWYITSHQDRYLQTLVPWMAAVVGVTIVQCWKGNRSVRVAVAALVAFQIIWSGDIYFFKTHAMIGNAPITNLAEHLGAGHEKNYAKRFRQWSGTFRSVHRKTPPDARIVVHRDHEKLGLGRQTVVDGRGYQSAIDYLDLGHAGAAYSLLKNLGVTHLMFAEYDPGDDRDELAREVVFAQMVEAFGQDSEIVEDVTLVKLRTGGDQALKTFVGVLSCGPDLVSGLYTTKLLSKGKALHPLGSEQAATVFRPATVILSQEGCTIDGGTQSWLNDSFRQFTKLGPFTLLVRKGPTK